MQTRRNALLLLHLIVFIWGFTGILGKLIDQSPLHLVYTRTVIGLVGMALAAWWLGRSISPLTPHLRNYLLTGLIIAAHWITFFAAIKLSTASIAAACLSTSTVFTALLEPFWFKRKIRMYEVVLGVIVVAALIMIFGIESKHRVGIAVATLSAFLSAWFNVVNAVLVSRDNAIRIGFYEMVAVVLSIGIYLAITNDLPLPLWKLPTDTIIYQLILGLVCTSFAFVIGIAVMRQLSPFTVVLTVNLEPIYTIIIALMIWGAEEKMELGSYFGIVLILGCLMVNGWLQRKKSRSEMVTPAPLIQG